MTFSPPSDAPYFRGKTLTPESPLPLHIPEPSSIPVLQNQIDPIFNQMSTHMEPSHNSGYSSTLGFDASSHDSVGELRPTSDNRFLEGDGLRDNQGAVEEEDIDYVMTNEDEGIEEDKEQEETSNNLQSQLSSSSIHPPTFVAAYEHFSTPTQQDPSTVPPSHLHNPSGALPDHIKNPNEPSQLYSVTDGQTATFRVTDHDSTSDSNAPVREAHSDVIDGGVNYQTLLDNLSPSIATTPGAENNVSSTTSPPADNVNEASLSNADSPIAALPTPVGLPPRPPPQEKPAIHPNYTPGEDIRSYHYPHTQNSNAHASYSSQPSNSYRPSPNYPHPIVAGGAPGTSSAPNGLPPPPLATFQQPQPKSNQSQRSPLNQQHRPSDAPGRNGARSALSADNDDDPPWSHEMERRYGEFLHDEGVFVSEGLWDRFPSGSRLFVGNLYTEKVSKRDLFYVFHKYGKLAQVSIKQAYGFIQYLDSVCCHRAMQAEQGMSLRSRKMHLEISKPQKNSRNAVATVAGDNLRAGYGRRSRSPDFGRGAAPRGSGQRSSGDRIERGVPFSDFRDEPRRRDDYRPRRSPSPRGFRGRDEYRGGRDRSPERVFYSRPSRSRSPYGWNGGNRSRSPRGREYDEDADLPLLRRDPRDVPDVQLILIEEVDRTFVAYIEKSFRDRGLRCDVLQLPRASLAAVIKRQILEGVQAVVKVYHQSQVTGKVPLQVFDRSAGADNVRFDEFDDLDVNIAAELVVRAKNVHSAQPPMQYSVPPSYGAPQYGQNLQQVPPQQPQQATAPPNLANLITSLDGPALQKLLGAIAQNPQPSQPQHQNSLQHSLQQQPPPAQAPDLAALLGNVTRQQVPQQQGYHFAQAPPQQPYNATAFNPVLPQQFMQQQQGPGQQHHVQNIIGQLTKWKQ